MEKIRVNVRWWDLDGGRNRWYDAPVSGLDEIAFSSIDVSNKLKDEEN